jgi:chromate transporter
MKKRRFLIFLKDVFILSITCFGGPHAHLALFIERLVVMRRYLNEEELMELNALCSILPGPTSTQTITAIGFKVGGPNLAYLTLIIWCIPAISIMTLTGLVITYIDKKNMSMEFTRYVQPMAVGLIGYAAYIINTKVVKTQLAAGLMIASAVIAFYLRSPFLPPVVVILGGLATTYNYQKLKREEKGEFKIEWANFVVWAGVFIAAALLGAYTHYLPVRLFENFYRNGSLIFGGGQVLIPLMYNEFVMFKHYLFQEEFLFGYSISQMVPGPTFSICSYIGVLAMRDFGFGGQILGAFLASAGIFLPGTFLIFFVIRFWNHLKKYRFVKASLEGITATSSGLVIAAALSMFQPIDPTVPNMAILLATFIAMMTGKVPTPLIIILALAAGFIF